MADGAAKFVIELRTIEDDLFRMDRFHRAYWNRKVAGILDIDDNLGTALRGNDADRAEFLTSIGSESLKSHFNFFLHKNISNLEIRGESLVLPTSIRAMGFHVELLSPALRRAPGPSCIHTPILKC
jgi:hypothetical protein